MNLYKEAASFLNSNASGTLQKQIFEASKNKKIKSNPKQVYAMVYSTLKYKPFLQKILKKVDIPVKDANILLLMVHDLLLTKAGRIHMGKTPLKEAVLKHKTRLNAEYIKLKLKLKVKDLSELVKDDDHSPVRWIRVNPIKATKEQVMNQLKHLTPVSSWEEVTGKGFIYEDEHIPNLFAVSPLEKIHNMDCYKKGQIIIQDRASCFPAHILNPAPGDHVIDACSAPGNKTTHAAAHMHPEINIDAFEKDPIRSQTLKKMIGIAGASKQIRIHTGDFTKTKPEEYPTVTGFIVDPSCSGSGIFGRAFDEQDEDSEKNDANRLIKLSSFQVAIVKHAMMFPAATKIVYSTCSVHAEENERVVGDLLLDAQVQARGWKVRRREGVIPTWPRRGYEEEFASFENKTELAQGCIRTVPKEDGGIGFFAVCFERDPEAQE